MTRVFINHKIVGLLLAVLFATPLANATESAEQKALNLVRKQLDAQIAYDSKALDALLDEQYFEVSPVGEIDAKSKVVDFYNSKNKRPAPAVTLENTSVRLFGDTAVVIANMVFSMPLPNGETRTFAMTGSWVLHTENEQQSIVSAHYTPLRQ